MITTDEKRPPGRPTSAHRLADITYDSLTKAIVDAVAQHIQRLMFDLDASAAVDLSCVKHPASTSIGFSASLLLDWARIGTNGETWDSGMAMDAVAMICGALYSRAGEPGTFGGGVLDDTLGELEPDDPVSVLLLAAHCRVRIAQRDDPTYLELAMLAGMSHASIKKLVGSGELDGRDGRVGWPDAKRWLAARGVGGFRSP